MGWITAAFHENTNLEHAESLKVFLFLLKAVAAIAYVFVLGYLAAGGTIEATVWFVLLIAAVFDLVPELLTLDGLTLLPERARQTELAQLILTAVAYLVLTITLFLNVPYTTFTGYATFAALWIIAFLIQESVLFHLGEENGN